MRLGFQSAFPSLLDFPPLLPPWQLEGTDAITLSLRCSYGRATNLPQRLSHEINRHGAAFETGRDNYRNILDLLHERRDSRGDLLIQGDFTECWIAPISSFIFGEIYPVCSIYLREWLKASAQEVTEIQYVMRSLYFKRKILQGFLIQRSI